MDQASNISRRRRSALVDGGADYTAKREELVRIATRLFKEQGYHSTTLAEIAREAGLDRATVYYYVSNKEELFREAVEGVLDANIAEAERLLDDPSLRWRERLHAVYVRLMVSYAENYPATFVYIQQQMQQTGAEETVWAKEIMKKTRLFDDILLRLIREAIAAGELRSELPPKLVEHGLFGMLNWTHRWFKPDGPMTGSEIAEAFWSIFMNGMEPKNA